MSFIPAFEPGGKIIGLPYFSVTIIWEFAEILINPEFIGTKTNKNLAPAYCGKLWRLKNISARC